MAIKGNFKMGGIDYSTPSLNNNINYEPSFIMQPAVDVPATESIPFFPSVTNEMSSNRQPGINTSNSMLEEDMMKEVVKTQLQELLENKDVLERMDAGDGSGRNQYQKEIQDIITKSPMHKEAYIEEYPIGGTINTAVPEIMEAVVKAAVPGLSIGSKIIESFNINPKINNEKFSTNEYGYDSLGAMLDEYGILDYITSNNGINEYSYDGLQDSSIFDNTNNDPLKEKLEEENINNIPGGGRYGNNATDTAMDSSYSSGLNYARSIADGSNVANMIAPGVSYSSANPEGFTQADINAGLAPNPFEIATPVYETPDDPSYFGTGIGGANIPVDRHDDTPKDIFGGGSSNITGGSSYSNITGGDMQNITPDNPSFLGTGIGGVNIPVTRKQDEGPKDYNLGGRYQGLDMSGIQKILDNLS